MNRKLLSIGLILGSVQLIAVPTFATQQVKATSTENRVYVDGQEIGCKGFEINGSNYFKLRDIAAELSYTGSAFDISWNSKQGMIELTLGQNYTSSSATSSYYSGEAVQTATLNKTPLLVNGVVQDLTSYTIQGNTYFKLRDLAEIIPFEILFNPTTGSVELISNCEYQTVLPTLHTLGSNKLHNYTSRWASTVNDYIVANADQTLSILTIGDALYIDTYDIDLKNITQKKVTLELPLWGGFYSGENYNYIVYGASNNEENNNKEIIRIVKYDKAFNRLDSASITGGEAFTTVPFDAGSLRMAEYGDTLVVHTSRERYTTEDGLNHQSQLTILLDTKTMKVTNDLGRFQANHVSHSFNQYVLAEGNKHVLVDHGDAYPRSVVLQKGDGKNYTEIDLFDIPGKVGANCTGVSVGGLESTKDHYVVAINSIDHSLASEYTSFNIVGIDKEQRDVILCTVPKTHLTDSQVRQIELSDYSSSNKTSSTPHLVKLSEDHLLVLWQEYDMTNPQDSVVRYVCVDNKGEKCTEVKTMNGATLSSCQPIINGDSITWFVDYSGKRLLYQLSLDEVMN